MSGEANTVTSVEQDGRTLSGVGASADALEAVMERHAPSDEPAKPASETKPAEPEPVQQQTRGRQRFSDLTKERDEAKAKAEAAEKRAAELEAKLASPQAAPAAAAEPPKPATEPSKPERFTFPSYKAALEANPSLEYDDWEIERLQAFSDWKDQRSNIDERIGQRLAAERAAQDFHSVVAKTHAKGREAYADFDTMRNSGPGAGVLLGPTKDEAAQRVAFIVQHPQSEHLQYAISKDGDLARKLAGMSAIEFGLEIARIVPTAAPARPRAVAPPPAPYEPVNTGTSSSTPASRDLAGKGFDFDKSGYRERRAAERKAARR
jgi:hypothetical protein